MSMSVSAAAPGQDESKTPEAYDVSATAPRFGLFWTPQAMRRLPSEGMICTAWLALAAAAAVAAAVMRAMKATRGMRATKEMRAMKATRGMSALART